MNGERRTWIAGGVLAGLLAGGSALATVMVTASDQDAAAASIALHYVSSAGAACTVEVTPQVHSANPSAWFVARRFLENVDPQMMAPLSTGDEIAELVEALSLATEQEIFTRTFSWVNVMLASEYSCSGLMTFSDDSAITPPIVGDDFGREPTLVSGRAPDVVGFFRASTGQICEIQINVDPDRVNGATEDGAAVAARAFLASVDFTTVDYSATLRDMADYWPEGHDEGLVEASALTQTLMRQVHQRFDTSYAHSLPITTETWVQCDQP